MKTHLKLTLILIVVIVAAFQIINQKNTRLHKKAHISVVKTFSGKMDTPEIDSTIVKKLLPFFKIKKDEFDSSGLLSYIPKGSPERTKGNAIYCYFEQIDDSVTNLRFRVQVENRNWLFLKKCQFLIDGRVYDYNPQSVELNTGSPGMVCEWFDDSVNENNIEIIKALSNAKRAKVKISGRNSHKVVVISLEQIRSINNTLTLFAAMRGAV